MASAVFSRHASLSEQLRTASSNLQQSLDALRARLEKDLLKIEKEITGLTGRLANPNFAGKAPPEVVAECQANLAEAEAQAALARQRLADLG